MIDNYLNRAVLIDYILGIILATVFCFFSCKEILQMPSYVKISAILSDISTVGLTITGFVLTLLTLLISFKSNTPLRNRDEINQDIRLFDAFFNSNAYVKTVRLLKNAVKSLIVISVLGYVFRLTLSETNSIILYSFLIFSIVIVSMTIWRCILILNLIIKVQTE